MKNNKKQNESWNVSYSARDAQSGDDIMSLNMGWENREVASVQANLNTWLRAIGLPLEVVETK
jgi:tRNA threonylcarbamoyladenosine modification (KEOPS) complex  Pcc1 subunit